LLQHTVFVPYFFLDTCSSKDTYRFSFSHMHIIAITMFGVKMLGLLVAIRDPIMITAW
jgi:hypothetical protein